MFATLEGGNAVVKWLSQTTELRVNYVKSKTNRYFIYDHNCRSTSSINGIEFINTRLERRNDETIFPFYLFWHLSSVCFFYFISSSMTYYVEKKKSKHKTNKKVDAFPWTTTGETYFLYGRLSWRECRIRHKKKVHPLHLFTQKKKNVVINWV